MITSNECSICDDKEMGICPGCKKLLCRNHLDLHKEERCGWWERCPNCESTDTRLHRDEKTWECWDCDHRWTN